MKSSHEMLNDTLSYNRAADMPFLPSFVNIELYFPQETAGIWSDAVLLCAIKKEDFRKNFYKTEAEFKVAVAKYFDFYNDYRPHQRLGYLSPNQTEEEYYKTHPVENSE